MLNITTIQISPQISFLTDLVFSFPDKKILGKR